MLPLSASRKKLSRGASMESPFSEAFRSLPPPPVGQRNPEELVVEEARLPPVCDACEVSSKSARDEEEEEEEEDDDDWWWCPGTELARRPWTRASSGSPTNLARAGEFATEQAASAPLSHLALLLFDWSERPQVCLVWCDGRMSAISS